jgi:hypothetical protein
MCTLFMILFIRGAKLFIFAFTDILIYIFDYVFTALK